MGIALFGPGGCLDRDPEENEPDDKQDGDHPDAGADVAAHLGDGADNRGAHERGALAADVHQPEVFPRLFRRDNLRKPAAGEGLHPALEHPDTDRQEPEVGLLRHHHRKQGDAGVGDDADGDEGGRLELFGSAARR